MAVDEQGAIQIAKDFLRPENSVEAVLKEYIVWEVTTRNGPSNSKPITVWIDADSGKMLKYSS